MTKILKISQENLHEGLSAIRAFLGKNELERAVALFRVLSRAYSNSKYVLEARTLIAESMRWRFGEFLDDNATDLKLTRTYLTGFEKKLDISKDIPGFSELAGKALQEGRTSLYLDRLYTIYQSLLNVSGLAGDILELGVYSGGSLKFIAWICESQVTRRAIFGLDTFTGHAGVTQEDGLVHLEGMLKGPGLQDVSDYIKDHRDITLVAGDVRETLDGVLAGAERLAFVHLDLDLYEPSAFSLPRLAAKLVPGGIILVDDYGFTTCPGAKKATDEFLERGGFTHFHLLTGQCILTKRDA